MKRGLWRAWIIVSTGLCTTAALGQGGPMHPQAQPDPGLQCHVCGVQCTPATVVTKTIMVPTWITETRLKYVTETKTEERELPYTVFERVPVTKKYNKETCFLAEEIRTKVVSWKECRKVENPVVQTYTKMVPETETRVCNRTVCRVIDGQEVMVEEPYTYEVTVERPQVCSRTCQQPDVVFETKSDIISYCVKVPKKDVQPCAEETVYELRPIEKVRKVSVCVPVRVAQPEEVRVCKLVPHTVVCCPSCGHHGHHR